MKFLISLASKYIRRQKLRTALTFISVFLASFIMCISLLVVNSIYATMKNFEMMDGSWEVRISSFLEEYDMESAVGKISNHILVEDLYFEEFNVLNYKDENKSIEIETETGEKWSVSRFIISSNYGNRELSYSTDFYSLENRNGIILPKELKNAGYSEGDSIELTVSFVKDGVKTGSYSEKFTIEGFSPYGVGSGFSLQTNYQSCFAAELIKISEDDFQNYRTRDFLVRVKDNGDFEKSVEKIAADCGVNINFSDLVYARAVNENLLMLELKSITDPGLFILIAAIFFSFIFFIWLISRLIIDNAFEISVVERTQKFTTLKTFGASGKQLSALVFFEGLFYSLTAVPSGAAAAYFTVNSFLNMLIKSGVTFIQFSSEKIFVITGLALCMLSVFISAYTSALWMSRKKTITEASVYGSTIKGRIKKIRPDRTCSGFIGLFTKRNISRTKGKYIFSVLTGSVSVFVLMFYLTFAGLISQIVPEDDDSLAGSDCAILMDESGTINDVYNLFRDKTEKCDIWIKGEKHLINEQKKAHYNNSQIDMISEEEVQAFSKILPESGDFICFNTFGRKEYEKKYLSLTGIPYDEILENRNVFVLRSGLSPGDKVFFEPYSGEKITLLPDSCNLVYAGDILIHYSYCELIVPEELVSNVTMDILYVNLLARDGVSYSEMTEIINDIKNTVPGVGSISDNYAMSSGLQDLTDALKKMVLLFFVFLWTTGIVSMINISVTKVINLQREYFILRCCGMTKKSLVISAMTDLFIFASISVAAGVFTGITAGYFYIDSLNLNMISPAYSSDTDLLAVILKLVPFIILLLAANIIIPAMFSLPLVKKVFSTSSDVVNSNSLR
ncbi:MAG: ABC transporter permease [Oscillospiraceae bacterium]|nr:ABC transporter permease [Oscillospiraceae bacterium]